MKKIILSFILVLVLFGCVTKNVNPFYEILNQNFVKFADTIAYRYGTFTPIPNDTSLKIVDPAKKMLLLIDTQLSAFKDGYTAQLYASLSEDLKKMNLPDYKRMIETGKTNDLQVIDPSLVTKTGRYILIGSSNTVEKIDNSFVGQISFAQPRIEKNRAIVVATLKSSPKAGRSTAFLFEKSGNNWVIKTKIEVGRW